MIMANKVKNKELSTLDGSIPVQIIFVIFVNEHPKHVKKK